MRQGSPEHTTALSALLNAEGTLISSRRDMKPVTEKVLHEPNSLLYSRAEPQHPAGEGPPSILPSVRVAIKTVKSGTASGPNYILEDLVRAGGYSLPVILAIRRDEHRPVEKVAYCLSSQEGRAKRCLNDVYLLYFYLSMHTMVRFC